MINATSCHVNALIAFVLVWKIFVVFFLLSWIWVCLRFAQLVRFLFGAKTVTFFVSLPVALFAVLGKMHAPASAAWSFWCKSWLAAIVSISFVCVWLGFLLDSINWNWRWWWCLDELCVLLNASNPMTFWYEFIHRYLISILRVLIVQTLHQLHWVIEVL